MSRNRVRLSPSVWLVAALMLPLAIGCSGSDKSDVKDSSAAAPSASPPPSMPSSAGAPTDFPSLSQGPQSPLTLGNDSKQDEPPVPQPTSRTGTVSNPPSLPNTYTPDNDTPPPPKSPQERAAGK